MFKMTVQNLFLLVTKSDLYKEYFVLVYNMFKKTYPERLVGEWLGLFLTVRIYSQHHRYVMV